MIYALDTNILSFLLKNNKNAVCNADAATYNGHELIIPKIVDYEIRRGLAAAGMNKKLREYLEFRETVAVGKIDENVWDEAVNIYVSLSQHGKIIDDADILIAAFCLVNGYTLVTNNKRHFENIDRLNFVDWSE
ncbi:MAG: PIN domain-containing protein [Oscillospiraceae bacterium]|nr:PIN domain-containing protein [Oscillospiraceae bacterium]